jgi:hypothetical protein
MTPREQIEALAVGYEAKANARRRYSYPEADAADGAERDTYERCASDLRAVLASWTPEARPDEKNLTSKASSPPVPAPTKGADAGCDESVRAGWGWCPNTTLRIPKGDCGCCKEEP